MGEQKRPILARLDEIRQKLNVGDIGLEQALVLAYSEGVFDGKRQEPVVVRVGQVHTPEVET